MNHDRSRRRTESTGKRLTPQQQRRATEPDPAKMGLNMPDWLAADPLAAAIPAPPGEPLVADTGPMSDEAQARTVLEGMKVVCICKGIKQRIFWKALDAGMRTKEEINGFTGSGNGGCQGRRCGPRIAEMLRYLSE